MKSRKRRVREWLAQVPELPSMDPSLTPVLQITQLKANLPGRGQFPAVVAYRPTVRTAASEHPGTAQQTSVLQSPVFQFLLHQVRALQGGMRHSRKPTVP